MKGMKIRDAGTSDASAVVSLVLEMAQEDGEHSPVTESYAARYSTHPGCGMLLAEAEGRVIGLLAYYLRPDLYHAAPACLIELLFVRPDARGRGAGGALVADMLKRAAALGCAEITVSVMPDNAGAIRFYRRHGLTEEVMSLEKHIARQPAAHPHEALATE
jgi:ribosomal protein S18 acetylase RimI-like enzyme